MKYGSEDEPLGKLIGHSSHSFVRAQTHAIREAGLDISFENAILIHWLSFNPGSPQHDVRYCMDRDKTRIARVLDSLEKQSLVYRETDQEDRRIKRVFLTPEGEKLDRKLHAIRIKVLAQSLREIPEEEIKICRNVLNMIRSNLNHENQSSQNPVK